MMQNYWDGTKSPIFYKVTENHCCAGEGAVVVNDNILARNS